MTEFIITCESELKPDGSYKVKRFRELIRCKDCKYSRKTVIPYLQNEEKWCNRLEINRPFDWFCADAVWKDSE